MNLSELVARGTILRATVGSNRVSGTITLPGGKPLAFTATPASGKAHFVFATYPSSKGRLGAFIASPMPQVA